MSQRSILNCSISNNAYGSSGKGGDSGKGNRGRNYNTTRRGYVGYEKNNKTCPFCNNLDTQLTHVSRSMATLLSTFEISKRLLFLTIVHWTLIMMMMMYLQIQKVELEDASRLSFTLEQHRAILAMLEKTSISHNFNHIVSSHPTEKSGTLCNMHVDNSKQWILDTRATDHVCHSLSSFQYHKKIRLVSVRLLDGSQASTSTVGTVYFSDNLVLTNVLYLPTFTFNLISVSFIQMLYNGREGLSEIKPTLLVEAFYCQPRLIFIKRAISIFLDSKNLFASNRRSISEKSDECAGVVRCSVENLTCIEASQLASLRA
ncbi:hypothetical protein CR513_53862, partial [Mucuna pruriens]